MLYVILGPTGSGKTDIALKLADFYHAPIINADAFQIYQDMDIGTAKIEKNSEDYKKHYLLDIVKPDQSYSVKQYQEDFRKVYLELKKKYQSIIVCGGTGLYIRAALYDYVFNKSDGSLSGSIDEAQAAGDEADAAAEAGDSEKDQSVGEDPLQSVSTAIPSVQEGPAVYAATDREGTGNSGSAGRRKEYIALNPLGTEDVYIYGYKDYEEDYELIDITDEEEFKKVVAEFESLVVEEA